MIAGIKFKVFLLKKKWVKTIKCKVKDFDVYYETRGQGKPIIILHGFSLDHRSMVGSMEPVFRYRKGWRRIYPDLPGHGHTLAKDWINSSDDMLDVVLEFIDALIPNQRFVIVGLSYGGYLARGIIFRRFELIDGMLLIVPMVISNSTDRTLPPKMVFVKDEELLSSLSPKDREGFEEVAVIQTKDHWNRYKSEITAAVNIADDKFLANLQPPQIAFSFDVDTLSKPFEKPSLILVGRQDHWLGYKDAWKILENYPRATFAVLDRAGHCLQMEQEKLFNQLVSEWLDRVEESLSEKAE